MQCTPTLVQEKGLAWRSFPYPGANVFCGVFGLVEDGCQRRCRWLAVVHFPVGQEAPQAVPHDHCCICADGEVDVRVIDAPVNPVQVADEIVRVRGLLQAANDALGCDVNFLARPHGYE